MDLQKLNHSPFLFTNNNPISFIDLNGQSPTTPGSLIEEINKISENPENKMIGMVIDMQGDHWSNAFYKEGKLLENQKRVLEVLKQKGAKIIFIESNYGEPETHTMLRRVAPDAERIVKPQLNAFSTFQTRVEFRRGNYTHAVVMGTECENCVESTIMGDFQEDLSLLNHQGVNQLQEVLTAPHVLDAMETRVQSAPLFTNPAVEDRYIQLQRELRQDLSNQEKINELEQMRFKENYRVDSPGELPLRSHPRLRVMSNL